jgi:thiosulfate reductase cytochrome b subunit
MPRLRRVARERPARAVLLLALGGWAIYLAAPLLGVHLAPPGTLWGGLGSGLPRDFFALWMLAVRNGIFLC